ncbi:MAG: glucose-1-phosphate thymidylyltransferase [Ignavibacteriae bacterium]|nr:glucose-1-phosphate thymidylyltransferase [Ignavibacteriota bacterium]
MSFSILIAEPLAVDSLYPFSLLHCSWEVRCGALKLFEKVQARFPDSPLLFSGREGRIRSFLSRVPLEQISAPGNILVLHGGILLSQQLTSFLKNTIKSHNDEPIVFISGSIEICYYIPEIFRLVNNQEFHPDSPFFEDYSLHPVLENALHFEVESHSITYLWDAIKHNGQALIDDADIFVDYENLQNNYHSGLFITNPDAIFVGENCSIAPNVVLDASEGPIIFGKNVRIMSQSTIMGPCFIGDNSLVKIGAKIYGNTSIGEFCKVGGEIDSSIIHSYSSKQHDGFVGHSYIGEWVNLGADSNTSNLKNTYSQVTVPMNGTMINTEQMFLGLLCGDHSKAGINTMFTTGTVTGIFANIFGGGFFPQNIKSFSWGGFSDSPIYQFDKAVSVAEIVMQRRNYTPTTEEKKLWKTVFAQFGNFL